MTDQTNTQESQAPEGMARVNTLDQLSFIIANWFDNNQQQARVMYNVPDGTEISVSFNEGDEPEQIVLTGDMLKGFKIGMIVASNIFGTLPFVRVTDDAPSQENEQQPDAV